MDGGDECPSTVIDLAPTTAGVETGRALTGRYASVPATSVLCGVWMVQETVGMPSAGGAAGAPVYSLTAPLPRRGVDRPEVRLHAAGDLAQLHAAVAGVVLDE